jgi:Icc-related predicted phosphoesterase
VIRLAAVGDVHYGTDSAGRLRGHVQQLQERADLLLLAGDVTRRGTPEEAEVLASELDGLGLPVVAVLGNHDYHSDQQDVVAATLEGVGVRVLEGDAVVLEVAGGRVGVAGTKGFGGGFLGACGSDFGEPEMKAFVRHSKMLAGRLEQALAGLDADVRIALLHYSPIEATLSGERPEIYPFLGSYLLAQAVDQGGADLALHGHAHRGARVGRTPGGVPVHNVAEPVIRRPYELLLRYEGQWVGEEVLAAQAAS